MISRHNPPLAASIVVFVVATAAILTALAFQYWGGYLPCHLCLLQRYAYYVAVPGSLLAVWWARRPGLLPARLLLAIIAFAFVVNAGIGVYHSGVEWHWWPGPDECSGGMQLSMGIDGVDLGHAKIARCDQAAWRLLGLSFAGWNAAISAALALIAGFGVTARARP